MNRPRPINYVILLFLLFIPSNNGYHTDEWIVFKNKHSDQGMEFEKMVVDPSNTRLYVAGVNYLYDLHSSDLSVRVEAVTGPMDDSDQCKGGALALDCKSSVSHLSYKFLPYKRILSVKCVKLLGIATSSTTTIFVRVDSAYPDRF
ncbi:unnamed protein product [Heligmosomoides polygyrus]|uniref:Sema domain-containing protein n=1 Tax=Heligmosomoides polygyrus TaxID=6339 RepID=A0A3P7ZQ54_HELPZ|nr:unnamed protein product [Heligmosomoides polygyrus]